MVLDWNDIYISTVKLATKILSSKRKFDLIIGILRGGSTIAVILSDLLGLDVRTIRVKAYKGTQMSGKPIIYDEPCADFRDAKVLVVDDVCDTGLTFKVVSEYLKLKGVSSFASAALVKKSSCDYKLDYWVLEDDRWILFPWELVEIYSQDPNGVLSAVREGMGDEVANALLGIIETRGKD